MYQVVDCLNDESTITQEKRDADKICTDKGGSVRGFYVFPVDVKVDQIKPVVTNKPKSGELFDF